MPQFAVFGGTGRTGMPCIGELVQRGYKVRAIVRSRAASDKASARGAEPIMALADDAAAMKSALQGVDGLLIVIPAELFTSINMIEESRRLTDNVVRAAVAAKVPHVVALSSIGAQHSKGTGPIMHCRNLERVLASSGLPHTIVRAPAFFENWLQMMESAKGQGILPCMYQQPDHKFPQCAAADVGRMLAQALIEGPPRERDNRRHIIEFHGPEDYSVNDVAAALSEVLGHQVKVSVMPPSKHINALRDAGMSEENAKIFAELFDGSSRGLFECEGEEQRRGAVTLVQGMRALAGSDALPVR